MIVKVDLEQKEVSVPVNNWCEGLYGGHSASSEWSRLGPGSPKEPTKFFRVIGKGVDMVVCEPCLIVSRWWANKQKKENP